MIRIGVISDTHSYLDDGVFKHFEECQEIWHAGDIGNLEVTDQLAQFRPLVGVYGNIDDAKARKTFPLFQKFAREGTRVLMTHIGGKPYAYPQAVREQMDLFRPHIYVCGHSHILTVQFDKKRQMLFINPGAAGKHGFHKVKTLVRFTIDNGRARDMEVIELGPRA